MAPRRGGYGGSRRRTRATADAGAARRPWRERSSWRWEVVCRLRVGEGARHTRAGEKRGARGDARRRWPGGEAVRRSWGWSCSEGRALTPCGEATGGSEPPASPGRGAAQRRGGARLTATRCCRGRWPALSVGRWPGAAAGSAGAARGELGAQLPRMLLLRGGSGPPGLDRVGPAYGRRKTELCQAAPVPVADLPKGERGYSAVVYSSTVENKD